MNRLTIGRRGEFVVRVTMVRLSPFGIFEVSRCTLKLTLCPGGATGMVLCDQQHASESTLYTQKGSFPSFVNVNSASIVSPCLTLPNDHVLSLNVGRAPAAFLASLKELKFSFVKAQIPILESPLELVRDCPLIVGVAQYQFLPHFFSMPLL